jgi:hypothetical protein
MEGSLWINVAVNRRAFASSQLRILSASGLSANFGHAPFHAGEISLKRRLNAPFRAGYGIE